MMSTIPLHLSPFLKCVSFFIKSYVHSLHCHLLTGCLHAQPDKSVQGPPGAPGPEGPRGPAGENGRDGRDVSSLYKHSFYYCLSHFY